MNMPKGFKEVEVPTGFKVVQPKQTIGQRALNTVGEFAAGANRGVAQGLDFLTVDQLNNVLQLAGQGRPVPGFSDASEAVVNQFGGTNEGGFMQPGTARDYVRAAGEVAPAALGLTQVTGRNLANVKDAVEEVVGLGSQAPVTGFAGAIQPAGVQAPMIEPTIPKEMQRELALKRQSGDAVAAGFDLKGGKVVRSPVQKFAQKAGLDDGLVSMLSAANPQTKTRAREMISNLEKGRGNLEFRNFSPPQRVIGQAIKERLDIVQRTNRAAGLSIERAAKGLEGKSVDLSGPLGNLSRALREEGIFFEEEGLNFVGSSIEKIPRAKRIVKDVFELAAAQDGDALKAHRLKKQIDEMVTYGKSPGGLSGRMQGVLKQFRRSVDGVLDENFPKYREANEAYSETVRILDDIQGLTGSKVNLNSETGDKALGTMSRKILSNYNTGAVTEDLFDALDSAAQKYKGRRSKRIGDNLRQLVSLESELRAMFPSAVKPNTFQGEILKEGARVASDVTSGNAAGMVGSTVDFVKSRFSDDHERKLKALRALVK